MKNTRLVYNDEKNLKIYQALSPEDFKEFFMTYLTYKPGSELQITDFNNPLLYALFLSFKDKIDYNEEKWERQAAAKRENGKKGGRPKKSVITEVENNEFQVEQNTADLSPLNNEEVEQPQPTVDNTAESLKMGNNEIVEDNTYMERKPSMEIATSKQDSNMEKLQNIINTDDDFYRVYNNCIKAVAEYKLSNGDIIKANSKDMAMQKLKNLCHSYQIPYNEETYNFILKDVNYSISNMGSYSVA